MKTIELQIDSDGVKYWYKNDKLHREDGPAIEFPDGSKHWRQNDELHREGGPAVELPDGYKAWYQNNRFIKREL